MMLRHAGCTVEEICAITGHQRADVNGILDRHYLKNDGTLARAAREELRNALRKDIPTLAERTISL